MPQALLFVLGVAGLVALVPLGVLIATGRPRSAWRALREYSLIMGVLIGGGMLLGLVIVGIGLLIL